MLRRLRRVPDDTDVRLARLERKLEDVEDLLVAAAAPDRIDDAVHRLEELALTAATADDVLRVRTEVARLAAELSRVRADLQQQVDNVTAALLDASDPRFPRRATG